MGLELKETNYTYGFSKSITVECVNGGFIVSSTSGKKVFKTFTEVVNDLAFEFVLREVDEGVTLELGELSK